MKNCKLAAKAFIIKDNKLLIIRREPNNIQAPGEWEIPGGRLDFCEDPKKGLKREIKEEVGIKIEVLNPLTVRHFTRKDGQTITLIIFLCKPLENFDKVKLSKEHTEYMWIDIKKAKEKITDFFFQEVDIYKKSLQ